MKTKQKLIGLLVMSALLASAYVLSATLFTTPAKAAVQLTPVRDDFATNGDGFIAQDATLIVGANGNVGGLCAYNGGVLLGFDLSSVQGAMTDIMTATLAVNTNDALTGSGRINDLTMVLAEYTNDAWTEGPTDIPYASFPANTDSLGTSASSADNPATITFNSSLSLTNYLDQEIAGDGFASIVIRADKTGACTNLSGGFQELDSTTTLKVGSMVAPALTLEGTGPTAVTLFGTDVATQNVGLVSWVAGIVFILALLAGVVLLRRKPEEHTIA